MLLLLQYEMSEQCEVSEPAGLADDTEGEETTFESLVSPQTGTKMSFQITNSNQDNTMFLFQLRKMLKLCEHEYLYCRMI